MPLKRHMEREEKLCYKNNQIKTKYKLLLEAAEGEDLYGTDKLRNCKPGSGDAS